MSKKLVYVAHNSICLGVKPGVHLITVTKTGNLNDGKITRFEGTFHEAVRSGKRRMMRMGDGAVLITHGASENNTYFTNKQGRLYYAFPSVLRNGKIVYVAGKPAE